MKHWLFVWAVSVLWTVPGRCTSAEVRVVESGRACVSVYVDGRGALGAGPGILEDAAGWLVEAVKEATGVVLPRVQNLPGEGEPVLIIGRAEAWAGVAGEAGLDAEALEGCAIVARPNRLFLLGRSEEAARLAVACVLREWGFRYFAPSPRWHVRPRGNSLGWTGSRVEVPAFVTRKIWYAYGHGGGELASLMGNHQRWALGNRLSGGNLTQTGHSFANIVLRNAGAFTEHPEYFALLADGKRDVGRAVAARKFCYSNPGLLELVAADRLRLLEEQRKANPDAWMVSVDPSDGEGTCHCEACARLGTTTDRVLHLANHVARRLRGRYPEAWVGLYAYSSHRLPPSIAVEPNVYVQVAMAFNRTEYSLPELVERWSGAVRAIGLREYYGVEAWDWGLPGRIRGGQVEYHRRWIPFFAERHVNAINAETNANWGGQVLGHYVAAQLMWNPRADVDALVDEFYGLCFGGAAPAMRRLFAKFDAAPALQGAAVLAMFEELEAAWNAELDEAVRGRLSDVMAYLVYVSKFREFELVESREGSRNDAYYTALKPLMEFVYRIRNRDMVHYYALARRLCNGLPLRDGRPEFYLGNREARPVWMGGEEPGDREVRMLFEEAAGRLREDRDPTAAFSRYLERLEAPGEDAGATGVLGMEQRGIARFRKQWSGFLLAAGRREIRLGLAATGRQATLTVYLRDEEVLHRQEVRAGAGGGGERTVRPGAVAAEALQGGGGYVFEDVVFELPKAGEYRVEVSGDCVVRVEPETPLVYEASTGRPAWVDYSGPHYFYVPRGVRELFVDGTPRLSLYAPGSAGRIELTPASREPGRSYAVVKVPEGADGRVWHTSNNTRGEIRFLNIPPLLSFHRGTVLVPREVSEASR